MFNTDCDCIDYFLVQYCLGIVKHILVQWLSTFLNAWIPDTYPVEMKTLLETSHLWVFV